MVRGANEKGGQGKLKRNCVIDWSYVENKVKLTYADGTVLFVRRDDFDRAFGAILNAEKEAVERDYAI